MFNPESTRLKKEINGLIEDKRWKAHHLPGKKDKWILEIFPDDNTPYAGGKFYLLLTFPSHYPLEKPHIKWLTKTFHPMIKYKGELYDLPDSDNPLIRWTPTATLNIVLDWIMKTFNNPSAAKKMAEYHKYANDLDGFWKEAKEWTEKYAM